MKLLLIGSTIATLVSFSAVVIDRPPPGFDVKTKKTSNQTVDAGTKEAPQTKDTRTTTRRMKLTTNLKAFVALSEEETNKKVEISKVMFAQTNFNDSQDAALVVVNIEGDITYLMFVWTKSEWQVFPDTFK